MICGVAIVSAPPVSRRCPAADVDRQDRGCIIIEDHSVAADAEPEAVAALKGLHVALARHGIAVKSGFHLLAGIFRKSVEFLAALGVRMIVFTSDNIAQSRSCVKR